MLAPLAIVAAFGLIAPTFGAPGDVLTVDVPVLGGDTPAARAIETGATTISTQTGAFQYQYPIEVPPGRLGIQPSLALAYSSQGAIHGGVAAGWTLDVPEIRIDPQQSLLLEQDPNHVPTFESTLAGGHRLVPVVEPAAVDVVATFRAQYDSTYARYERLIGGKWRVRTHDGNTHYFGEFDHQTDTNDPQRFRLTRTVDEFGNTVHYRWQAIYDGTDLVDHVINRIEYTTNNGAGLGPHALVLFSYADPVSCIAGSNFPVGAKLEQRGAAVRYRGSRQLTKIFRLVRTPSDFRFVRTTTLTYDEEAARCDRTHGPLRILTSIQESAISPDGVTTTKPAVTFTYGPLQRNLTDTRSFASPLRGPDLHGGMRAEGTEDDWPRLDTMMIDFDGDGRPDRLSTDRFSDCDVEWERNTGNELQHRLERSFVLPTLRYSESTDSCSLAGQKMEYSNGSIEPPGECPPIFNLGAYLSYRFMDMNADGLPDLVAALHYDSTHYSPWIDPIAQARWNLPAGGPACLASKAMCPKADPEALREARICTPGGGCRLDQVAIDRHLAAAPKVPCDTLMRQVGVMAEDPDDPPNECPDQRRIPLEACGQYPWEIYWNQGGGVIDLQNPTVVNQPFPLETDSGDSSLGQGGAYRPWVTTKHAIMDVDGDGYPDGVLLSGNDNFWHVFRGDGSGAFRPRPNGLPYLWSIPFDAPLADSGASAVPHEGGILGSVASRSAMQDMNGDGLVDLLWVDQDPATDVTFVYLNKGNGFRTGIQTSFQERQLPLESPTPRASITLGVGSPQFILGGTRTARRFTFDFDQDGRTDFYRKEDFPGTGVTLLVGDGSGRHTPGVALSTVERDHIPQALDAWPQDLSWHVTSDFMDLDGDGVTDFVESIDVTGDGFYDEWVLHQDERDGKPLRLLNQIDNGAGGRIAIRYRPSTDPAIDIPGTDDQLGMPSHTWLVESVTTTDLLGPVTGSTTYRYGRPIWNKDDRGRYGFRGFERTQERRAAGAVIERRYDYTLDWSGREVEKAIYDATLVPGSPLQIDSIESTAWQKFGLFNGQVNSYQVVTRRTRTCSNGQTHAQCLTAGALNLEATIWQPQASHWEEDGPGLAMVPTTIWKRRGDAIASGDRRTNKRYFFFASADDYRLKPLSDVIQERQGTADVTRSHTEHDYDVPGNKWRRVMRHNSDGSQATEYTWVELPTGQVTGKVKPQQFSEGSTVRSHIGYDEHQVHVTRTENELHHVVLTEYDLGTGALLSTRGPNSKPCGPSCEDWEETRSEIDGFGRPLRTYVNIENPVTGRYESKLIKRFTYFDSEQPQRVREERRIDFDGADWVTTDTTYDGLGRVSTIKELRFDASKPDSVTTFVHDLEGRLASVQVPDPSQDGDATVSYGYAYNSLGEVVRVRRPDQTEITWSFNGLSTTRTEVANTGPVSETKTHRDVFDRLVQVDERLDDGSPATTIYAYDALDNISRVTNPDGIVTQLDHDWLGRRRRITRGGRMWRYEYDLNGNLVREIAPLPPGATEAAYTTSIVHDALDRPTSRLAGVRALSATEQVETNHGLVLYTYDQGINGKGRLNQVTTRDSVTTRAYAYDARGLVIADTMSFNLMPALGVAVADSRTQHRTYSALGQVADQWHGDGLDQGTSTHTRTRVNRRGLIAAIALVAATPADYAVATHNTAGFVTKIAGQNVTQVWTHDPLGRVTSMEARSASSVPNLQVKEAFTYFGMDDPATLTTFRHGLGTHTFEFDYDRRHQLIAATSDQGYDALFTYRNGGRLKTAYVASPTDAPLAPPRDVTYEYSSVDPEAVSRLVQSPSDDTFIAYTHDLSGNTTSRNHGSGETYTFLYDGDDWQRRATSPNGTQDHYYYDHDNRRILTVTRQPGGTVTKARLVHGNLEVEYTGAGQAVETTAHLSLDRPVGKIVNRGAPQRVLHGQLGNLLGAFNADSTALAVSYIYGPFGEILAESGDTSNFIHRFNGKEQDELTDLSYYGYRYFDPYSLTWTQADPLYRFVPDAAWDEPRRANLYAFCLQNPLAMVDPDGRTPGRLFAMREAVKKAVTTGRDVGRTVHSAGQKVEAAGNVASLVPVAGMAGDVVSATGSLMQGDAAGVGISLAALLIPGFGSAELKVGKEVVEEGIETLAGRGASAARKAGTAGGDRAGKPFTPKARAELDAENAARHEGANVCENCGTTVVPGQKSQKGVSPPGNERQRDHIIPKSKGGNGDPSNGEILCRNCNLDKRDKIQ